MTKVYLADAQPEERSAFRVLLLGLQMEVVGEATDWATTSGSGKRLGHAVGRLGLAPH